MRGRSTKDVSSARARTSHWSDAATALDGDVVRTVRFVPVDGCSVFVSSYRARDARLPMRLLVCPSWGLDGEHQLGWCHGVAMDVARAGGEAVVLHWPGFQDSEGAAEDATFDGLVDALTTVAGALDADVAGGSPATTGWSVAGIRFGAAVATVAGSRIDSPFLALVQPEIDPAGFVESESRAARRAQFGSEATPGWAFGTPVPDALGSRSGDEVTDTLRSFRGRSVVVRHAVPAPANDVPAGATVVVPGRYGGPRTREHRRLRRATARAAVKAAR